MSLKKRAIEGIVVAGSLVMMSTIAQAADLDGVQVRNAAVQAETDFGYRGNSRSCCPVRSVRSRGIW